MIFQKKSGKEKMKHTSNIFEPSTSYRTMVVCILKLCWQSGKPASLVVKINVYPQTSLIHDFSIDMGLS
jgi:hypothetical protein